MKKLYSLPIADVCLLSGEDVLTLSGIVGNFTADGNSISQKISATTGEGDKLDLNW